jgi:hypothetical protein
MLGIDLVLHDSGQPVESRGAQPDVFGMCDGLCLKTLVFVHA